MRLEHVCDVELNYLNDFVMARPYGTEEGAGYGDGDAKLSGPRLEGTARWSNHPRRSSDGVFWPDLHGVVSTNDGADLLLTLQGRSDWSEDGETSWQLARVTFMTDDERYGWANDSFCVAEGVYHAEDDKFLVRVFSCVNEMS
jgi:hypothetical protein